MGLLATLAATLFPAIAWRQANPLPIQMLAIDFASDKCKPASDTASDAIGGSQRFTSVADDLPALMQAIDASGLKGHDEIVEFIGTMGVPHYADCVKLYWAYRHGGQRSPTMANWHPGPAPSLAADATRLYVEHIHAAHDAGSEVLFSDLRCNYDKDFATHGWPPASDRALGLALANAGFIKRVANRNDAGKRPTTYIVPERLKKPKRKGRKRK